MTAFTRERIEWLQKLARTDGLSPHSALELIAEVERLQDVVDMLNESAKPPPKREFVRCPCGLTWFAAPEVHNPGCKGLVGPFEAA
jgi:hypothetical protein